MRLISGYTPCYTGRAPAKRDWSRKTRGNTTKPSPGRIFQRPEGFQPDPIRRGIPKPRV